MLGAGGHGMGTGRCRRCLEMVTDWIMGRGMKGMWEEDVGSRWRDGMVCVIL